MKSVSVMIKPSSSNCNLNCKYCFYKSLASERKEESHGMMTADTSAAIIKKVFDYADGGNVSIVFQGGEPLLSGLDFYNRFFTLLNQMNEKAASVYLSVQTNGLLIDDDYADIFYKNNVLVGLSLDGDAAGNVYRTDADGNNSVKDILRAAKILKKHKVEFNILSVVTKQSAVRIKDIYNYFKSKGFRYLQFIPCLKPLGSSDYDKDIYMNSDEYYNFMSDLFEEYYDDFVSGNYVSVRIFDNYVMLADGRNAEQCSMSGRCSRQFVIEGNGDVYPCDFYCLDEYLMGNINDSDFSELEKSESAENFVNNSSVIEARCKKCRWVQLCRGTGCKRYKADGDMCEAYSKFFNMNAGRISNLAGIIRNR